MLCRRNGAVKLGCPKLFPKLGLTRGIFMKDNTSKRPYFGPYFPYFAPYWGCPGHPLGPFFVAPMVISLNSQFICLSVCSSFYMLVFLSTVDLLFWLELDLEECPILLNYMLHQNFQIIKSFLALFFDTLYIPIHTHNVFYKPDRYYFLFPIMNVVCHKMYFYNAYSKNFPNSVKNTFLSFDI